MNDVNETCESQLKNEPRENVNFVQVERSYLKEWRALTRKSPVASELLMYLVENMSKHTNAVVCSYKTLGEILGVSRPTVGRSVKILKDNNWISTVKIGTATAYAVNAKVFWRAARNQKRYAIFSATVIASESEQDEIDSNQELRHIPFVGEAKSTNTRFITNDDDLPPPDQQDLPID